MPILNNRPNRETDSSIDLRRPLVVFRELFAQRRLNHIPKRTLRIEERMIPRPSRGGDGTARVVVRIVEGEIGRAHV